MAQQADTLYSASDVLFYPGDDTLIEIPEDLEFTDGAAQDLTSQNSAGDDAPAAMPVESQEKASLWGIFIAGILGGFAAFIMPCIFPMVPLTVSFFT
ncbi:hypothetical protein [Sphingobacterium sp. JB170]|uniref:hypothetical protein n=1 Tax=Sphingobacterium sp. JB170 TaxID=1434842 RepID=UPI001C4E3E5E|nr:hypothetical protein [Sphingobacterium sp. JB170]